MPFHVYGNAVAQIGIKVVLFVAAFIIAVTAVLVTEIQPVVVFLAWA